MTTTASITVCQPQPSSRATSDTPDRCGRPATSTSVLPVSSTRTGQRRSRRCRRTSSGRRTCSASVACATPVVPGGRTPPDQRARLRGRCARVVIAIRNHLGQSPTPMMFTSGRPTSSAHMRVASVSKQGLLATQVTSNITENCRAPATRPGSTRSTDPNPQTRRAPLSSSRSSAINNNRLAR